MLVLMGKSGCGKTTIEDELIHKYGFVRAISHTTRPKREKDIEGVNYFFVSKEEMEKLNQEGKLAERIEYLGEVYALVKEQCRSDRVVVVAPDGLKQLLEKEDLNIFSVLLNVDREIRKQRMIERGDSIDNIEKRLQKDDEVFEGSEKGVDVVLDNTNKSVDEITEEILRLYKKSAVF